MNKIKSLLGKTWDWRLISATIFAFILGFVIWDSRIGDLDGVFLDLGKLTATVYPNPTNHSAIIKWANDNGSLSEIIVRDMLGREIMRTTNSLDFLELNTTSWAIGMYVIEVNIEEKQEKTQLKLIINR